MQSISIYAFSVVAFLKLISFAPDVVNEFVVSKVNPTADAPSATFDSMFPVLPAILQSSVFEFDVVIRKMSPAVLPIIAEGDPLFQIAPSPPSALNLYVFVYVPPDVT